MHVIGNTVIYLRWRSCVGHGSCIRMEREDDEIEAMKAKKLAELLQAGQPRGEPSNGKPVVLTDATFSGEVSRHPLVVVDFWAPWCGPCRMVGPVIEQLASDYAGRVTFGKVNVDENPEISGAFGIQSIPTLMVFRDGKPVDGLVGAAPRATIEGKFQPYLKGAKPSPAYR